MYLNTQAGRLYNWKSEDLSKKSYYIKPVSLGLPNMWVIKIAWIGQLFYDLLITLWLKLGKVRVTWTCLVRFQVIIDEQAVTEFLMCVKKFKTRLIERFLFQIHALSLQSDELHKRLIWPGVKYNLLCNRWTRVRTWWSRGSSTHANNCFKYVLECV